MAGFPKKSTETPEEIEARRQAISEVRKTLREGVTKSSWDAGGNHLQAKLNDYYELCDSINQPYTWPGLAIYLGMCDTSELAKKAKSQRFTAVLARAKTVIEGELVNNVVDPGTKNSKGIAFVLTNNYGYRDKPDMTSLVTVDIQRPTKKDAGTPPKCGQLVISTDLSDINDLL